MSTRPYLWEDLKGAHTPGPSVYPQASGIGRQLASSKANASRFSFGTEMRAMDPAKKNPTEVGPGARCHAAPPRLLLLLRITDW